MGRETLCVVTQVHTLQFRRSLQPGGDSWRVKYQLLYALSSMLHAHQPELAMSAPSHCQKAAECGDVATYLCLPQRIPTRIWRKGDQMFCSQDLLWCPPYVGVNLRDPGSIATSRARTIRACSLRLIEGFEGYPDPLGFIPGSLY